MSEKIKKLLNQAEQLKGESSISCAEKKFFDTDAAERFFSALRAKIISVDEWNAHSMLSSYAFFDETGRNTSAERLAVGVFIRIALRGSGKYDWVRVIDICDVADEYVITVRPTYDPTGEKPDKTVVSHFFTDESTNNFCLSREGKKVTFYVIGLNEKMNVNETKNIVETVRNAAVNLSTYLGVQNGEWKKFCHHFLEDAAGSESSG